MCLKYISLEKTIWNYENLWFSWFSCSRVFVCRIGRNLVCTLSWRHWLCLQEQNQDLMYRFKDLKKWIRGRAPPLPGGGGWWPPAGTRKLRKSVFLLIFIFEKQCEWRSHRKMLELSSWRNMQFLNWKSIFSKYTIKYIKKSKNSAEYLKYAKYQLKKWLKSQNQWVFSQDL